MNVKCADCGYISFNSVMDRAPQHSYNPIWPGVSFYVGKPWPPLVCVQDYDVTEAEAESGVFEFKMENGEAKYQVLGRCEYGCAWHARLSTSRYIPVEC